jgi:hypothetical protein
VWRYSFAQNGDRLRLERVTDGYWQEFQRLR